MTRLLGMLRFFAEHTAVILLLGGARVCRYASTYIRMFFEQYAKGVAPELCPGNDNHNVVILDEIPIARRA